MSKYQIILRNIKNIRELFFPFPERKGVYVLTGSNGSGKTSLLTALSRLGKSNAFAHYRSNQLIDKYPNASVEYRTPTDSVTYVHGEQRWVPSPKRNNVLLSQFPFHDTRFVSTAGTRFFTQEQLGGGNVQFTSATNSIKKAMNDIMGTTKFNDLQYITIGVIRGRQRNPHRDNKLYVIKNPQTYYSEQNFSLGERLLLNTLEELENVSPHTLLLIDEVELSLHPIAQVKFYDFLAEKARDNNLCIILSTHSSTLIKHAQNRIYLENNNGMVRTIENCFPAYILRTLSTEEDKTSDFIFFVEDTMAKWYLEEALLYYHKQINRIRTYTILPIGGYPEVVKFLQSFPSTGYNKRQTQAFLDADVRDAIAIIRHKGARQSVPERELCTLFDRNANNISYLSITPEVGMWQWIEQNADKLKQEFDDIYGLQNYSIEALLAQTAQIEAVNLPADGIDAAEKDKTLRTWGKGCFKNFIDKVKSANPQLTDREIINTMISCYVKHHFNINNWQAIFEPLFNRR